MVWDTPPRDQRCVGDGICADYIVNRVYDLGHAHCVLIMVRNCNGVSYRMNRVWFGTRSQWVDGGTNVNVAKLLKYLMLWIHSSFSSGVGAEIR